MAEVDFVIGHKNYTLSCQEGEERLLKRAAALLDGEAQVILAQAGRMPEPRLLLLAGLMLADRHNSMEDRALAAERELTRIRELANGMVASEVQDSMAELAARAEALAQKAEDKS